MSVFAVEFAGCVWTVAVSGKKKKIKKYPEIVWTRPKPTAAALRFVSLFLKPLFPVYSNIQIVNVNFMA